MSGFTNVDVIDTMGNVDIVHDLTEVPYPFAKEGEAEQIISVEFLEHISFRDIDKVLKEWYRILGFGGKLVIQVPDCGKAMEYYVNKQICDCVPHKAEKPEYFKANEKCPNCNGRGMINPVRWIFSFLGAQKNPYDLHQNIFTKESMENELKNAGFRNINFREHIYKIIVECEK